MKKAFCRIAGILLAVCLLIGMLSWLGFVTTGKRPVNELGYSQFFHERGEYDVLFFGNSHVSSAIYPTEIWTRYGITSFNLACPGTSIAGSYWLLKNTLPYCKPKAVVLDVNSISQDAAVSVSYYQTALAPYPLSLQKLRAVFDLCPPGAFPPEDRMALLWGFSVNHSRWASLTANDFAYHFASDHGGKPVLGITPPNPICQTDEQLLLSDQPGVDYLRRFTDECRKQDIQLLLVYLPFPADRESAMEANSVETLARELDVPYINYLKTDLVDFETDCHDADSHLNFSGGLKLTLHLGRFLAEEFELPDHRGDTQAEAWEAHAQVYRERKDAQLAEQNVLPTVLMLLSDPQYASVIRLAPGSPLFADPQAAALLRNLSGGEALPGFDEAAASGQSYLLLVNRREGVVLESVGSDSLPDTPFGAVQISAEEAGLTLGETSCALTAGGDALCFVFTADMEPLPACSHAFAPTAEGIWERCDY